MLPPIIVKVEIPYLKRLWIINRNINANRPYVKPVKSIDELKLLALNDCDLSTKRLITNIVDELNYYTKLLNNKEKNATTESV